MIRTQKRRDEERRKGEKGRVKWVKLKKKNEKKEDKYIYFFLLRIISSVHLAQCDAVKTKLRLQTVS